MNPATTMRDWWRRREAGTAARKGMSPAAALREFFRYHGVMAPGVRLLRSLPMGAKVAVVASAFVVPLTFGALRFLVDIEEQVQRTHEQRSSVSHWRMADTALGTLRLQRLEQVARIVHATGMPVTRDPLDPKSLERLHESQAGEAKGSARDWARLQESLGRAAATTAASAARFTSLLDTSDALLDYSRWIGRGTLDLGLSAADLDQARFATQHLPRLAACLAAVGDLAALMSVAPPDISMRFGLRQRVLSLERAHSDVISSAERLVELGLKSPGHVLDLDALIDVMRDMAGRAPEANDAALAQALVSDSLQVHEALSRLQAAAINELDGRFEARLTRLQHERVVVVALLLLLTSVPVYLLVALHRVLAGGMVKVIDEVRRISDGDLSVRPSAQGRDEVAGALNSLSSSLAMLADMFAHVRSGATAVAHASGEIARGNTDLEERTVHSRQGLERVVDAVRACVALLDQCGRRVDDTVAVVDAMRLDAAKSRANMTALENRMQELRRKSGEIDAIVELIDGIAFRTNILALNASIESSKAGEAGRGFAVVAQEVRRLAQRSAENAHQIGDIVGRAREDIERGAALADHTGVDLKSTDGLVLQVHDAMRDVVQLTRQGQHRSQEILDEVRELMTLTDANGELVHQIAGASQALSAQGRELSHRVESFKLS